MPAQLSFGHLICHVHPNLAGSMFAAVQICLLSLPACPKHCTFSPPGHLGPFPEVCAVHPRGRENVRNRKTLACGCSAKVQEPGF